jgi:hypothetical protein
MDGGRFELRKNHQYDPVSVYSGSAETFLTYIALLHKENAAVVVSANGYSEPVDQACKKTLKELIYLSARK